MAWYLLFGLKHKSEKSTKKSGVVMETMDTSVWMQLPKEKREKAANLMSEFSAIAVTWHEEEKEQIFKIFSDWITASQEEYKIKPHQLIVIAKMLQETAFADLIEWLPEDFEDWEDKDELLTVFFFGQKGLELYREEIQKNHSSPA